MNEKLDMLQWNEELLKDLIKIFDKTRVYDNRFIMDKDTNLVNVAHITSL